MKIISHRGYWKSAPEKNTFAAFQRSFSLGFGTETDVRDHEQRLVVSHDMATGEEINLIDFLRLASTVPTASPLTLALNVKADGLAAVMSKALTSYSELDCFVFDMSVPEMRSYFEANIPVFTRMSDVEQDPVWLDRVAGVWLDSLESEWYETSDVLRILRTGKRVCIVSPELHHRPHQTMWTKIKPLAQESNLMLCTDFPEHAAEFFNKY